MGTMTSVDVAPKHNNIFFKDEKREQYFYQRILQACTVNQLYFPSTLPPIITTNNAISIRQLLNMSYPSLLVNLNLSHHLSG